MDLTLEAMPGPTEEARRWQLTQRQVSETYAHLRKHGQEAMDSITFNQAVRQASDAYHATVVALEKELGPDVHCPLVDIDAFTIYAHGVEELGHGRVPQHISRGEVIRWLVHGPY